MVLENRLKNLKPTATYVSGDLKKLMENGLIRENPVGVIGFKAKVVPLFRIILIWEHLQLYQPPKIV